jgi:hypothetical protein
MAVRRKHASSSNDNSQPSSKKSRKAPDLPALPPIARAADDNSPIWKLFGELEKTEN